MNRFIGILWLFIGFSVASQSQGQYCGVNYPTTWIINNPSSDAVNLACRIYYGGWSYQQAREMRMQLEQNSRQEYSFPDHNDGLGMVHRNWSCAVGSQAHPLMVEDSEAFTFIGCPDTEMTIPGIQFDFRPAPRNISPERESFCPRAQEVSRQYQCDDPNCSWDRYGAGKWIGKSRILDQEILEDLRFKGVDADRSGDSVLGCLYYSEKYDQSLILLSYKRPQTGSYPQFRYKPHNLDAFAKVSGNLLQCLNEDPLGCPLALR